MIEKKCKRCEICKPLSSFHVRKDTKDGYAYYCKVCFKDWVKARIDGSVEGRLRNLLHSVKARYKKEEFDIDLPYLVTLYTEQKGLCALTGDAMTLTRGGSTAETKIPTTISLDRIDNTKGYIKGNVQFVTLHVNIAKNCFSSEMFIALCKKVSEKHT